MFRHWGWVVVDGGSEREHSPLRKPEDAHLIDTTRLDFGEQVEAIVALVDALEG